MAITKPEHLDWCDVQYDVIKGQIHCLIKHDGATRGVTFADHARPEVVMRQVFKIRDDLMTAARVAEKLSAKI